MRPSGTSPPPALIALRDAGLSRLGAVAAALSIALHPAMLAACLAGAADMFLVLFLYLLGGALFELRARTAAPEVMAVGLSLLGLAFSHPMGAAVAFAVVPGLVFAVRPMLVANSALNLVVALVFPTVFAVGAFSYVSWVFPGDGWSFLAAPTESLAGWAVDAVRILRGLTGSLTIDAAIAVATALVLGAPLAPVALGWVRGRRPLVAPPVVFAGAIVFAAAITVATGLFGSPASLAVAAPILAAVLVARLPVIRERERPVLALLAAGWIGGALGLAIVEPRAALQIGAAFGGPTTDTSRADALALGGATAQLQGVLIDTDNAPAVIVGRGAAHGLIAPSDQAFTLTQLFARIDAPYVAVPDPHTNAGLQDRLNKSFPQLFRNGIAGYRLTYRNKTWRLYARERQTPPLPQIGR